jgi:hypothetical protein
MKKIIFALLISVVGLMLTACGPHMYKTMSAGHDDASYVMVLTEGESYQNVSVVIDGTTHPYGKVYKVKAKRKAGTVIMQPGKHNVKVMIGDSVYSDEEVFMGAGETKIVILR